MNRRSASPAKIQQAHRLRTTASATEKRLWHLLRGRQILGFKFRRRSLVYGYIPDFWCPEASLVVEIDGADYVGKGERDQVRDARLLARGIRTVHVPSELVWRNTPRVLERIRSALEVQRGRVDA